MASQGVAAASMPQLLKLMRTRDGWTDAGVSGNVQCRTREVAGSEFHMVLGQRRINDATPAQLARLAAGVDTLPGMDEQIVSTRTLTPAAAGAEGVYASEIGLPWPLTNRTLCWSEAVDLSVDGGAAAAICTVSVAHPDMATSDELVLAKMVLGGFLFEPLAPSGNRSAGGCVASYLIHFEPGGSLPSLAANAAVGEHVAVLDNLATAVEREAKNGAGK